MPAQTNKSGNWINEKKFAGNVLQFDGKQFSVTNLPIEESAEQNYLGILMLLSQNDPKHPDVREFLPQVTPEDFYFIRHAYIYRAMQLVYNRGEAIAIDVVVSELNKHGKLEEVGGAAYIASLVKVNNLQLETYAKIVMRASAIRYIIGSSEMLAHIDTAQEFSDISAYVERHFHSIQQRMMAFSPKTFMGNDVFVTSAEQIRREALDPNFKAGLQTGFRDLDRAVILRKGELLTVSAPTGYGKSMFCLNGGYGILEQDESLKLLYIALEDDADTLMERIISMQCMIDSDGLKRRELTQSDLDSMTRNDERIQSVVARMEFAPMLMPTMKDIETRIMASLRTGCDAVIIDWLDARTVTTDAGNENQATSEIFSKMRELKKELALPMITAVQMNRQYSARADQKPQLSDLAWSGMIEKVSDAVMFIHLPFMVDEMADPECAELIFRKNRTPGESVVPMRYMKRFSRFEDWNRA